MILSQKDFKPLEFNILDIQTEETVKKKFPLIYRWREFKDASIPNVSKILVLKYIFVCYDKNSPLVKIEKNVVKRKQQAADIAGFERTKDGTAFQNRYRHIMEGKNNSVNEMIVRFIIHQKDLLYSQFVWMSERYYKLMLMVMKADEVETPTATEMVKYMQQQSKVDAQLQSLNEQIDQMYDDIFLRDRTIESTVYDHIETDLEDKIIGFPEIYAERAEESQT